MSWKKVLLIKKPCHSNLCDQLIEKQHLIDILQNSKEMLVTFTGKYLRWSPFPVILNVLPCNESEKALYRRCCLVNFTKNFGPALFTKHFWVIVSVKPDLNLPSSSFIWELQKRLWICTFFEAKHKKNFL